jgi:chromosomal replication initiator protein
MSLELDPRLTFDSFVVGTSNRLAAGAARRVADAPGRAYNPLFLYSASGLGKTHLVMAMGHHIRRVHPGVDVVYDTLEHLMDGVMEAIAAGERDAFRSRLRNASVLLLDDVQFLAGRRGAQEELLRSWDALFLHGGQIVLASDRPPMEIDGLDERLLSRFSGGLITDLSMPDYETRVAIVRRKAEERGQQLSEGVAEALARTAVGNVRELQGGLNRLLAVQELDGRSVTADEAARLLGTTTRSSADARAADEFSSFLSDVAGTLTEVVARAAPDQLLAEAVARWQREGFRARRLEAAAAANVGGEEADALLVAVEADAARLTAIAAEIRELDAEAPELARADLLQDTDRVVEAEALLDQVRRRTAPLPAPPSSPGFEQLALAPDMLAVRAARAVALQPGAAYNPFFVHGERGAGKTSLATALALHFADLNPAAQVAFITGEQFAAELIAALERNHVDAWRARFRRARLLVIDGVDALMDTERAQEELFHLFDSARRAGVQFVFTAACPPRELSGFEERLRTRLESGLVVDITARADAAVAAPPAVAGSHDDLDEWFLNREKVPTKWPYVTDGMMETLD